jgi:hypothetical protein
MHVCPSIFTAITIICRLNLFGTQEVGKSNVSDSVAVKPYKKLVAKLARKNYSINKIVINIAAI